MWAEVLREQGFRFLYMSVYCFLYKADAGFGLAESRIRFIVCANDLEVSVAEVLYVSGFFQCINDEIRVHVTLTL